MPGISGRTFIRACYVVGTLLLLAAATEAGAAMIHRSQRVEFGFARSPARYTMLVVFTPDDCASYGAVITALNLTHAGGRVAVKGILVGGESDDAERDALLEFAPRFPVMRGGGERARTMLTRMGYRATPTVAVIDPSGRVAMVIRPDPLPWKQVDAVRLAEQFVIAQSSH